MKQTAIESNRYSLKLTGSLLALAFLLTGCSTLESAYEKTKDTVSGWFKTEPEKK